VEGIDVLGINLEDVPVELLRLRQVARLMIPHGKM
jgi:hypothetical protein